MAWLIVLAVAGTGLLVLWLSVRARDRRRFAARAAAAGSIGWATAEPVPPELVAIARRIVADGTASRQVLGRYDGFGFHAFDHFHSASRTSTGVKQHVVAVRLPVALPALSLTPDSAVARALDVPDQELESEAFNRAFVVTADDARFASAVLHPRLMEWMLHHPQLAWWIEGRYLLTVGLGWWSVPSVTAALQKLTAVAEQIPPFVLTDYGTS